MALTTLGPNPHGNLEEDLDAWVDRELHATLSLCAQIYGGPRKSLAEIVEEKIAAARNWRWSQQRLKLKESKQQMRERWQKLQKEPEQKKENKGKR